MQFYEIEMLEIPKLLFACTVELEHYRGSFHNKPRFLEILLVEHPEHDSNYQQEDPPAIGRQSPDAHRISPTIGSGNMPPYGSMLYRRGDGKKLVVPPGMLMVTTKETWCDTSAPPGQHQRHTTVGVEMEYRCRLHESITAAEKEQLLKRMRTTPGIFLIPQQELMAESAATVRNAIGEIGARNASPSPADRIRALAAYHSFAAKLTELVLQRLDSEALPPAAHRYARAAKAYIHTRYREKIRVGEIADELGISEGYLHSIFRAATGYSVLEYCNRYRVETAIQYLKGRNMTLREIALQVGLEDPYYLSRLFKKVTGLSPKEYRKQKADLR